MLAQLKRDNTVTLLGFDGYIDGNTVQFTFNVSPGDLDQELDYKSAPKILKNHIKHLYKCLHLMNALGKHTEYETDFYWSEGDLLIRIEIPLNHPTIKHLKLPLPK